jgi:hypothetical protein
VIPRRKKPRSPSPPPVVYPKLLCIGGPRDGEIVSALDLPIGAVITADAVRRDQYVKAEREGWEVWLWQELQD